MHLGEGLVLGKGLLAIAHTVTLEIRLGSQVNTILVAEVIPARIIGIVTGTYSIDVELLHDLDVLNHPRYGHGRVHDDQLP